MKTSKTTSVAPRPETKCSRHPSNRADWTIDGAPLCEWCLDAEFEARLAALEMGIVFGSADLMRLHELRGDIRYAATELIQRAEALADNLTRIAERLKMTPGPEQLHVGYLNATVNSSGEVQGRGLDVDLLCQKLTLLRRQYGQDRYRWAKTQSWFAVIK